MTQGRLQAWMQQQLATGLPALAGARASASVPLSVDLLNELIADALADAAVPARASTTPADAAPDVRQWLRHVRSVRVDAAPGVITLEVAMAIDD